jgi:rhodanese-related sulfurtransferase
MTTWRFPLIALTVLALGVAARGADEGKDGKDVPKLTVEEFDKKRTEKDTVVLDVRTPEEFKAGHVPGAVNLDIGDKDFDKKVEKLDKDKTYIVHCARGGRSARAAAKMKSNFANLYDFSGGMTAWQKAGKPVEKTPEK